MSKIERYRKCDYPLPGSQPAWYLWGTGFENLGQGGRATTETVPECGNSELLVRVDAVSICASDAKMVRIGSDYPLFEGRDLHSEPVRLGHELSLTVVRVGSRLRDRFTVGERLGIQPDVYFKRRRLPIGVLIDGGLTQYMTIGKEILSNDLGSNVFRVDDSLDYFSVSVTEPWACVEMSYQPSGFQRPRDGGRMVIVADGALSQKYEMKRGVASNTLVCVGLPVALLDDIRKQNPGADIFTAQSLGDAVQSYGVDNRVEDVVLVEPRSDTLIRDAQERLSFGGTLNIVGRLPNQTLPIEVSRVHYDRTTIVGSPSVDLTDAYFANGGRTEPKEGGVMWIAGAGGSMGRMHVIRALSSARGPRHVVATNRGTARLSSLVAQFAGLAARHGKEFSAFSPTEEPDRLSLVVRELTDGQGFDDVVVVAPNPDLMTEASSYVASDGTLSLFAGLPRGVFVPMQLDTGRLRGVSITGSSGSTKQQQMAVLEKARNGELHLDSVISAVCGMNRADEAIKAVADGRLDGKVVVYPHLPDLPLLTMSELIVELPQIGAAVNGAASWAREAEEILFEKYLP